MRTIFICLVFFPLSGSLKSQQIFQGLYTDSLGVADYDVQIAMLKKSLIEKGLTDEMADAYVAKVFPDINSFWVTAERNVSSYPDSAIIILDYTTLKRSNPGAFTQLLIPYTKLKIAENTLYRFNANTGLYTDSPVPDSDCLFDSTGEVKTILGYSCTAYTSKSGTIKIWVTNDLPSTINPGITVKNVKGAVLRFETINGNALTISTISGIQTINSSP